ncbi:hypothetical protein GCM10009609_46640 [Pseudonocardia aurantiaca]|uniref:Lipoprotein n=1 Tax=Pseudonocardia aurantiaca TaxID=75290 RepID=A0ABW4FL87_9PSEU
MRRVLIILIALSALLAATACTGSSRSSRCSGSSCTISLTGEQTVDVEFGTFERSLRVAPIEPANVTVSARGEQARLAVGQTGVVGGLAVTLTSVSGRDVGLEVRRR